MPRRMTEQERQDFLAEPRVGVLSVASDDNRPPLTVPVWYGYEPGGNVTFFTGTQGRRARKTALIEKAGVLSLSVQREEFPYRHVTVEGTVVGIDRPSPADTCPRRRPGDSSKRSSNSPRASSCCSRSGRTAG
jgi:uncharacterized protein